MKKTKELLISILVIVVLLFTFNYVNAYSGDLDPEDLITLPLIISNGTGSITIDDSQTGYTLYYQAVPVSSEVYDRMEEIRTSGKDQLDAIKAELDALDAEVDKLQAIYKEAEAAYEEALDGDDSEATETAKVAYETALNNYQAKVKEYNTKVEEYNNTSKKIVSDVQELIPNYVSGDWISTEDGLFKIDTTQLSGTTEYVLWVRLDTADGATYYDAVIYTISGNSEQDNVESIELNRETLSLSEGSNYTLVATITPATASTTINWSSSNEEVATVENGVVTAVAPGRATITASTADGKISDTCEVTVTERIVINTDDDNDNNNNDNNNGSENNDDQPVETKDPTTAEGKLPQTGEISFVIILGVITLGVVGVVAYKKVKHLNFK